MQFLMRLKRNGVLHFGVLKKRLHQKLSTVFYSEIQETEDRKVNAQKPKKTTKFSYQKKNRQSFEEVKMPENEKIRNTVWGGEIYQTYASKKPEEQRLNEKKNELVMPYQTLSLTLSV